MNSNKKKNVIRKNEKLFIQKSVNSVDNVISIVKYNCVF